MYASKHSSPKEAKIAFYEDFTHAIEKIPRGDFLVLIMLVTVEVIGKYDPGKTNDALCIF